ncbi:VWA domain-containing protein [Rossellomorea vietnamensis]|uniref:VWA domain-containing protein n=1 Tax=Rossellomorea vietnamensis TaxID=218284 RepID=UPI001E641342|nr:VWA domain-containing protein [Rossellomorea vietnamensis]MCC5804413.1 VWA domain-containing protein [Rossellomorea vietnamensis]
MKYLTMILLSLSLILIGCDEAVTTEDTSHQSENNTENSKQEEEKKTDNTKESFYDEIKEVPESAEELINQSPGQFAAKPVSSDEWESKVMKEIRKAPSLSENPTEEEYDNYFKYLYSLVSEDFQDPQELLKKWEYAVSGTPNATDEKYKFKENYNIEVILDSSGSMKNKVGNQTQMALAKESIHNFLSTVPEEANVSLRVYGHKGTGSDADKEKSCSSVEQVYDFKPYNEKEFEQALNSFQPSGWTPIEGALKASKKAFSSYDSETNTNLIYLVSDGIETCDGNPSEFAKTLADSNINPIVNVIGFNVDSEAQKQLKEIASNTDGTYTTVTNSDQLESEFNRAKDVLESWKEWKEDALDDVDAKETDAYFDVLGYTNDFYFTGLSQSNNLSSLIQNIYLEDIITQEDKEELQNRLKNVEDLLKEAEKEIENDLNNSSSKRLNDLKEEINNKYDSNTNP